MALTSFSADFVLVSVPVGQRRKGLAAVLACVGTLTSVHVHMIFHIVKLGQCETAVLADKLLVGSFGDRIELVSSEVAWVFSIRAQVFIHALLLGDVRHGSGENFIASIVEGVASAYVGLSHFNLIH